MRNRVYTLINIGGLTLGMSIAIVIFLVVDHHLGFDDFHSEGDRIYRVVHSGENASGKTYHANIPYPSGRDLSEVIQGVELFTEFHFDESRQIRINGDLQFEDNIILADSSFFSVFDFEVISGNPAESLRDPGKAFVTRSFAERNFESVENAIGSQMTVSNMIETEIVGVIEDPPANSHIQFQVIISFPSLSSEYVGGFDIDTWGATLGGYLYVLLEDGENPGSINSQFETFFKEQNDEDETQVTYFLQPLEDIHFDMRFGRHEMTPTMEIGYIRTMTVIGLFIILIASINFVNLSTATSLKRSREVGIRKTLGAKKSGLMIQFLGETSLIAITAMIISMAIVERLLPLTSNFLGIDLSFNLLSNPTISIFIISLLLLVILMAGFYPSMVMSGFVPIKVLRSRMIDPSSSSYLVRRTLVVFQFFICQILIVATIIIIQQLNYFNSKPLGFNYDSVITMDIPERDSVKMRLLKDRIKNHPDVKGVSFGVGVPTSMNSLGTSMKLDSAGDDQVYRVRIKTVDADYLELFDLQMLAGSWYTDDSRPEDGLVLNETGIKKLGFTSPEEALGHYVEFGLNHIVAPVIGVVADYHTQSMHNEIRPVVMLPLWRLYYEAGIKINSRNPQEAIDFVVDQFEELFPGYLYEYQYMDEYLEELYAEEQRILTMVNTSGIISILIGCLGLYGLVSFIAIQKIKEVGIRKTLGAGISSIIFHFSKEFMVLLTISFLLAVPAAAVLMTKWLATFAYKIELNPFYFISGYVISIVIAGVTVGYKSFMTARVNPVEALKED